MYLSCGQSVPGPYKVDFLKVAPKVPGRLFPWALHTMCTLHLQKWSKVQWDNAAGRREQIRWTAARPGGDEETFDIAETQNTCKHISRPRSQTQYIIYCLEGEMNIHSGKSGCRVRSGWLRASENKWVETKKHEAVVRLCQPAIQFDTSIPGTSRKQDLQPWLTKKTNC